jgi:hypothetical protein
MRALTSEQLEALAKRHVLRRIFVWCEAKHPTTGEDDPAGFWDDVGVVTLDDGRPFHGSALVSISTLSAKSDFSIPAVQVLISGVAAEAVSMIRGSTVGQAPISIDIGIFDVDSHALVGPLVPFFRGFVDDIDVVTPPAGGKSNITLTCESTSRALTIKSTHTRSPSSLQLRREFDKFYDYTAGIGEQPIYFGRTGA